MSTPGSIRSRKKAKTRRALIEVSQRLFGAHGYAGTTLGMICDEVEITPQTLLRYFDSKADLAVAPLRDTFEAFDAELADPDRTDGTLVLWRRHVEGLARKSGDVVAHQVSLLASDSVLLAMASMINVEYEEALRKGIARDAGVDPDDDLYGRLLGALLIGGNASVYRQWIGRGAHPEVLLANQLSVIDAVEQFFPDRDEACGHGRGRVATATRPD